MSVSQRWRVAVISNPRLWTCIRVVDKEHGSCDFTTIRKLDGMMGDVMIEGRWQICQTKEKLMVALARSGTLPIRFSYFGSWQYDWVSNSVVALILTPTIAARIEALSIEDSTKTMQEITQHPVQRHLPHLREVSLSGGKAKWALKFLETIDPDRPIKLSLKFGNWEDISSFEARIWAKVPEAFLSCVPRNLFKLNLQALRKLEFEYTLREERDMIPHDLRLPSLISLKIYSLNPIQFLRYWHMPLLTTLDITHKGTEHSSEDTFHTLIFPRVVDFRIATQEGYRELGFIYGFVPNVQRLTFIELNYIYIFSDQNLLGEMSRLKDAEICPALQSVTFGDVKNPARSPYNSLVGRRIGKIQRSRMEKGGSLIHFEVFMPSATSDRVESFQYAPQSPAFVV